jgi:hypothetical protein
MSINRAVTVASFPLPLLYPFAAIVCSLSQEFGYEQSGWGN